MNTRKSKSQELAPASASAVRGASTTRSGCAHRARNATGVRQPIRLPGAWDTEVVPLLRRVSEYRTDKAPCSSLGLPAPFSPGEERRRRSPAGLPHGSVPAAPGRRHRSALPHRLRRAGGARPPQAARRSPGHTAAGQQLRAQRRRAGGDPDQGRLRRGSVEHPGRSRSPARRGRNARSTSIRCRAPGSGRPEARRREQRERVRAHSSAPPRDAMPALAWPAVSPRGGIRPRRSGDRT